MGIDEENGMYIWSINGYEYRHHIDFDRRKFRGIYEIFNHVFLSSHYLLLSIFLQTTMIFHIALISRPISALKVHGQSHFVINSIQ